jgi:hypothetical protein
MTTFKRKKNIFEPSNPDLNKPPAKNWDEEPERDLPFCVRAKQCSATSKATGTRCLLPAVKGYRVCRMHGANPKNPGGISNTRYTLNDFAMKSGAYACRFMEESERLSFQVFMNSLLEQIGDWNIADLALAQTAGLIHIRITRAITQTDEASSGPRAVEDLSKSMTRVLKALGITREGQKPKGGEEKTFAELALEMIEKAKKGDAPSESEDKKQTRILPKPKASGSGKEMEDEHISDSESRAGSSQLEHDSVFD